MTTYNTGNPLGSKDPKDLYDNAENLDTAVNDVSRGTWSDRLGRSRKTMSGMEREFNADQVSRDNRFNTFIASSGYQFLGDYAAGIEITEYNQIVRDADGEFWRLSGQVELPYTTTGAGLPEGDALTPLGDAVLRQELASPDIGALIVRGAVIYVNTFADLQAMDTSRLVDGQAADINGTRFRWSGMEWEPVGSVSVEVFSPVGEGGDDSGTIQAFFDYMADKPNPMIFPEGKVSYLGSPVIFNGQAGVPVTLIGKGHKFRSDRIRTQNFDLYYGGDLFIDGLEVDGEYAVRRLIRFYEIEGSTAKSVRFHNLTLRRAYSDHSSGVYPSSLYHLTNINSTVELEEYISCTFDGIRVDNNARPIMESHALFSTTEAAQIVVSGCHFSDIGQDANPQWNSGNGLNIHGRGRVDSSLFISDCYFKNMSRRSIKSQIYNTQIKGIYIDQDESVVTQPYAQIDTQLGYSFIDGIQVRASGTRVGGAIIHTAAGSSEETRGSHIRNIRCILTNGASVYSVVSTFDQPSFIDVSSVFITGGEVDKFFRYEIRGFSGAISLPLTFRNIFIENLVSSFCDYIKLDYGGVVYPLYYLDSIKCGGAHEFSSITSDGPSPNVAEQIHSISGVSLNFPNDYLGDTLIGKSAFPGSRAFRVPGAVKNSATFASDNPIVGAGFIEIDVPANTPTVIARTGWSSGRCTIYGHISDQPASRFIDELFFLDGDASVEAETRMRRGTTVSMTYSQHIDGIVLETNYPVSLIVEYVFRGTKTQS